MLSLCLSQDERLLFSSAGDRFVNVWDTFSFKHLASVYSTYDVGDIFCISYSSRLETIYLGCQNTSIQVGILRNPARGKECIDRDSSGTTSKTIAPVLLQIHNRILRSDKIASLTRLAPVEFEPLDRKATNAHCFRAARHATSKYLKTTSSSLRTMDMSTVCY